jgi:capsular polysaccharide biosynthesis protein
MSDEQASPDLSTNGGGAEEVTSDYEGRAVGREVSVLDLFLIIARNRTLIVRTVLVFVFIGGTYALLAQKEYTSTAEVIRETEGKGPDLSGGLGGIAGGLAGGAISGILGGATSGGLGPSAYPEVLRGRAVRLAVVRDTFRFPGVDRRMTFVEYANRSGLLGTILNYSFKGSRSGSPPESGAPISVEEDEALKAIKEMVSASVDQETGIMSISVTAEGPQLAADLAQSFLRHLEARVRQIRTKKVREQLEFVRGRFREAETELEASEDRLAQFLEQNQNPTTATLRFRQDRLQRQVQFKEQLYSKLQSQLTETRLDLQQQQPVVTVVEKPVPPMEKSAPSRVLIVVLCLVLGGFIGIGVAFGRGFFQAHDTRGEEKKMEEIRRGLSLNALMKDLKFWEGDAKQVRTEK